MIVIVFFSASSSLFQNGKTSIPVRAYINAWTELKADGNLGFLT